MTDWNELVRRNDFADSSAPLLPNEFWLRSFFSTETNFQRTFSIFELQNSTSYRLLLLRESILMTSNKIPTKFKFEGNNFSKNAKKKYSRTQVFENGIIRILAPLYLIMRTIVKFEKLLIKWWVSIWHKQKQLLKIWVTENIEIDNATALHLDSKWTQMPCLMRCFEIKPKILNKTTNEVRFVILCNLY